MSNNTQVTQQRNPVPRDVTVRHFPNTGVSIAYRQEGDVVSVGVAVTSPNDNFSRRLGREIAIGRLNCPRPINWRYEFRTQSNDRREISEEVSSQILADIDCFRHSGDRAAIQVIVTDFLITSKRYK